MLPVTSDQIMSHRKFDIDPATAKLMRMYNQMSARDRRAFGQMNRVLAEVTSHGAINHLNSLPRRTLQTMEFAIEQDEKDRAAIKRFRQALGLPELKEEEENDDEETD